MSSWDLAIDHGLPDGLPLSRSIGSAFSFLAVAPMEALVMGNYDLTGLRRGKALLPLAWRYVSRRMPPEEETEWRAAERRGQGEEWLKDRWQRRAAKP